MIPKQILTTFLIFSLLLSSLGVPLISIHAQAQETEFSPTPCIIFTLEDEQGNIYGFTDNQGNVRLLTDASGAIVKSYNYDPFGNIRNETGTQENNYKFSGEQLDPESGLYFLRARYYDPTTGRFISKDPVKGVLTIPQTQNPYVYSLNNPVNLSDPSGKRVAGLCLSCSGGIPGLYGQGSACIAVSSSREVGIVLTGGGGGTTSLASIGLGIGGLYSEAETLDQMAGADVFTGGSAKIGGGLQGDVSLSKTDEEITRTYTGEIQIGGVGSPYLLPVELHGGVEKSWVFNILP